MKRALCLVVLGVVGCDGASSSGSGTDTDAGTSSTSATAPDPGTTDPGTTTANGSGSTGSTTTAATSTGVDESSSTSAGSSSTGPDFVGSPGCGTAPTLLEGENTFSLDGYDRRYILRLPENYDPEVAWPLVFALHGNGGDPTYWDETGGDRDVRTAFATEAIVVIPHAINNAWRDYDADPSTWPMFMDLELSYFDTMHEALSNDLCIAPEQVFAMGFSGGGSYSGVLGCRRDYIRAIAVGGSVIYFDEADCTETPAAWITIGDEELAPAREAFRDFFRDRAGCADTSMPAEPDGCVAYDDCGAETPAMFCGHPGGHVWPPLGTDATREFFRRFYLE